ncbi:hypothetical protein [Flavobacterium limi]|uniref:Uncharacterized protein n=1 Tax=Flavobacterium limi TaxID=2045105 RepID=A0ABQ1U6Q2_9FLAO|nr:hypothetical protein [Flavobacterium limi]GGF10283.1 hypothetical protein GCM10011518_19390 [Flavobacterium limi]
MTELKDFYKNILNTSTFEIMKFINEITNKDLSLLILLNSEFNILYLKELEQISISNKSRDIKTQNLFIENLIDENCDSSTPTDTNSIFTVDYYLSDDGFLSIKKEEHKFELLGFRDYNRINCKIKEFQKCIKAQIELQKKPKELLCKFRLY